MKKKWDILFIKDENSAFDLESELYDILFNKIDFVQGREQALECVEKNKYDIIIGDLSADPKEVALLKQIKDKNLEHSIFALVLPKDSAKLYSIADMGINAFEITSEQFEQALGALANYDPYQRKM